MSSLRTCLLVLLLSLIFQIVPGPRDMAQGRTVSMLLVLTPPFEYAAGTLHKHSGSVLGLVHSRNSPQLALAPCSWKLPFLAVLTYDALGRGHSHQA